MNTKEVVPFHEAAIESEKVFGQNPCRVFLSGDRVIEVWPINKGVAIRIFRPTTDGKISKLGFCLTLDAAWALTRCLFEVLLGIRKGKKDSVRIQGELVRRYDFCLFGGFGADCRGS